MKFVDKLRESAKERDSIVCMGLDPVLNFLPEKYQSDITRFEGFLEDLITEMDNQKVFPGAFKPNLSFYEKHDVFDHSGSDTLLNIIKLVHESLPGIPVILDSKRGDIGKSSTNYAIADFENKKADAITVAPYMGADSIIPFAEYTNNGKGVYILNRTSNAGAAHIQSLPLDASYVAKGWTIDGKAPVFLAVTNMIVRLAKKYQGVGAVIGGNAPEELSRILSFYAGKEVPGLIPGVGDQGGSAKEVSERMVDVGYDRALGRINSSSGLLFPWRNEGPAPADYAKVVVDELNTLNEQINFKP